MTIVTGEVSLEHQGDEDAGHGSRDAPGTIPLASDLRVQSSAGVVEPVRMYELTKVRHHKFELLASCDGSLTPCLNRLWQPSICCTTMIRCRQELLFTGMDHLKGTSISL